MARNVAGGNHEMAELLGTIRGGGGGNLPFHHGGPTKVPGSPPSQNLTPGSEFDPSSMEGGMQGFYNKEKKQLNDVELLTMRYNSLDKKMRTTIAVSCGVGFFVIILMLHLLCSSFGLFVILSSIVVSLSALLYSLWILGWILQFDEGTLAMREVSEPIREGSEGFFAVQYGTIIKISGLMAVFIFFLYVQKDSSNLPGELNRISSFAFAVISSSCFLVGALCSAFSGYAGMWVSVRANVRVASAARRCYNEALQLCFRGGALSSIVNVALAVGGISFILLMLSLCYSTISYVQLPLLLVGYGFGASLVAMFAQLGGGIYTKGADVGADLVGKVEAGIPEDDPRNPAVIADLVGDNVGDCAGQCADLFESIAAEIISAMILGGALADDAKFDSATCAGFVLFPLGVHCMDLVISSVGMLLVYTKRGLPDADSAFGAAEDPLKIMIRAYIITCVMGLIGFTALCRYFLYVPSHPDAWKNFAMCGAVGMLCAFLTLLITKYYTDYEHVKVQKIAEASVTGPATNIIEGMAVGLESTALPIVSISFALVVAYLLGIQTELLGEGEQLAGLFGTAVATMGMLCTAVFVLSMSSFGPIADNAGGIVEMSQQGEQVRAITDRLDAVGNVTKANTKGFSVGSAALACLLLFFAFLDEISVYTKSPFKVVDIAIPYAFVGGMLGGMMVFLFAAWAMVAVGRAAQEVVKEVRRQFAEHPGIMEYQEKPDYCTCVAIVSRAALRETIKPGLLSVFFPIVVGVTFRILGAYLGSSLLGAQVVASFLMFSSVSGIMMALFLNNAGGAWDNAKKYVESGAFGGKGSDAHKAAVVGDTVGDPCKDTVGPSLHVLIKLVSTVTVVLAPLFVSSGAIATGSMEG